MVKIIPTQEVASRTVVEVSLPASGFELGDAIRAITPFVPYGHTYEVEATETSIRLIAGGAWVKKEGTK